MMRNLLKCLILLPVVILVGSAVNCMTFTQKRYVVCWQTLWTEPEAPWFLGRLNSPTTLDEAILIESDCMHAPDGFIYWIQEYTPKMEVDRRFRVFVDRKGNQIN